MAKSYDIKRAGVTVATVKPTGRQSKKIMGESVVDMAVPSSQPRVFQIGDTVDVYGETYVLNKLPDAEKQSKNNLTYNLHFEAAHYDAGKALFLFYDNSNALTVPEFSLMGNAETFIDLVIANMNRFSSGWTKGVIDTTDHRNISFSGENCLSVLYRIAEEYSTEVWFEGKAIHLTKKGNASGISFKQGKGKGLLSLSRTSANNKDLFTRLFVFGSEKNIPADYKSFSKRLRLPGSQLYIEDAAKVAKYGLIEAPPKIFDEIYPRRDGTVTTVYNELVFSDAGLDFNINDQLIEGMAAKVVFTTGQCAGYEFEIDSYTSSTKAIKILQNKEEKAIVIPSATGLKPAVGDRYVIVNINMPASYVTAAENELLAKGQNFYDQNSDPAVTYDAPTDPLYLRNKSISVTLGDYVNISDEDLDVDKDIRVIGLSRDLQDQYDYQLELADTVSVASIVREYAEREEVQRVIDINKLRDANRARQSWRTSEELRKMIFDPDDYFDTGNIRPASIETGMVSVGVKSQQFILNGLIFSPNNGGDVNNFGWSSGFLSHYSIEPTIREWTLPTGSLTGLSPSGAYYIYAFCTKIGNEGQIQISATQYKVDEFSGLYCFLIGVLHSVIDGYRGISLTYGATTINGRAIKTGIIYSQDGQTWFDLDTGELHGNFTFSNGDSVEQRVNDAHNLANQANTTANNAQDFIDNVLPGELSDLQNQIDGSITTWFYDHVPSLANAPANAWGTTELRNQHLGDIFYDTETGFAYRFQVVSGVYSWQQLQDSDITEALAKAAQAQDTADQKRRVFVAQPVPPYDIGDLWTQGANGDLMRCAVARATGSFQAADWIKASKYTDDTVANAAQAAADAAQQDANDANALLEDIASDSKLTPSEKQQTKLEWDGIVREKPTIEAQADQYGIVAEKSAYTSAYNSLSTYITPLLSNLSTTSDIVGSTFRGEFSDYYDKRQLLLKAITDGAKEIGDAARRYADGAAYLRGKMMYRDADFRKGYNGISFYDNSGNGNVSVTRIASPSDQPSTSPYALRVRNVGSATPGAGGWRFAHQSRVNAKFIVRFIAKIPVGYTIGFATNGIGSGSSHGWATGNSGTGKWEEYIYYIQCGTSGTFSSTAYFYLNGDLGTPSNPLDWFLSYASLFDVTEAEVDYKDLADQAASDAAQAAAEAANAQNTADTVADLTDFLTTKISGNVVSTGTMLTGSASGPNAGISGVVHAGAQSIRFWAGSDYAGRTSAPFRVRDDGKVFMTGAEVSGIINASGGEIGAFEIDTGEGGALAARNNNGYLVGYNTGHHFYFGPNGQPSGTGFYSTGVIRQTANNGLGSKNIGLEVKASGGDENYALYITGGSIAGLAYKVTIAPNANYFCTDSDVFILAQYDNNNIYLPSSPERGKLIIVVKTTSGNIAINGNGKQMTHRNNAPYTAKFMEWSEEWVFDGTYWRMLNRFGS